MMGFQVNGLGRRRAGLEGATGAGWVKSWVTCVSDLFGDDAAPSGSLQM